MDYHPKQKKERVVIAYLKGELKRMFLTSEFQSTFNDLDIAGCNSIEDIKSALKKQFPQLSDGIDIWNKIELLDTIEDIEDFLQSENLPNSEVDELIKNAEKFASDFLENKKRRELEAEKDIPKETMGKVLKFPNKN